MDIAAVASAFAALGELTRLTRSVIDVRDEQKLKTLQADMTSRIVDLQLALIDLTAKHAALIQEHAEGKARCAELEDARREHDRYALHALVPGAFVYRLRDGVEPPEPTHYLCQVCYDKGVKAVLEHHRRGSSGAYEHCPACGRSISV